MPVEKGDGEENTCRCGPKGQCCLLSAFRNAGKPITGGVDEVGDAHKGHGNGYPCGITNKIQADGRSYFSQDSVP